MATMEGLHAPARHVAVIGAGMGGLACAAQLAAAGCRVTVLEQAAGPGGKLRQIVVGGELIDSGPTVCTMPWVFEDLFSLCGDSFARHVTLTPLPVLARHAWAGGATLDLWADRARSEDAIGHFAGAAEARGYRDFCTRSQRIYTTLLNSFIRAEKPTPLSLMRSSGVLDMARIAPFTTLWRALAEHFQDPRLQQLFGRYATYCGASPMEAPATLMLVAHVEQQGVWTVTGGMQALAQALADLAGRCGAALRYGAAVERIVLQGGRVCGVDLAGGERISADAVVCNTDAAALASGLFGAGLRQAVPPPAARSLSAMTWSIAGSSAGFELLHHNIFFSKDYAAEFDDIFRHRRLPSGPTVYLCAPRPGQMFCIMNAPAIGDTHRFSPEEIAQCGLRMTALFQSCGLQISQSASRITTPTDFSKLFPATGGALYGPATHGPLASFRRPGARSKIPGLYLAGGSVHPGPGVPMAALSGRQAAASLLQDGISPSLSRRADIDGGTLMH